MLNIIMEKHIVSQKYDKAFVTGCDEKTEWMLPWFFKHYNKHNKSPLIFANFGVTEKALAHVKKCVSAVMNMSKTKEDGWFKKPKTMLFAPARKLVWIDTDCQIVKSIDDIFDKLEPGKLAMVEDKPWTTRRGELWHNSGIVGMIDKPIVLRKWAEECQNNPRVGDQEVLHSMLNPITKITYITDLPNEYNWLRIQIENDGNDNPNKKVIHWTGHKGKLKIKEMMNV